MWVIFLSNCLSGLSLSCLPAPYLSLPPCLCTRLWWLFNFATHKNPAFIPAAETNYIFVDLFRAIQPTIHLPIFPAHSRHRSGRAICCNQSSHKYARSHHTGPTWGEEPTGGQLDLCKPTRLEPGTRDGSFDWWESREPVVRFGSTWSARWKREEGAG